MKTKKTIITLCLGLFGASIFSSCTTTEAVLSATAAGFAGAAIGSYSSRTSHHRNVYYNSPRYGYQPSYYNRRGAYCPY